MAGKKNVVFGFLFLVLTAALGPYMVSRVLPDIDRAGGLKQEAVGAIQMMEANEFELDLEPMSGEQIAQANSRAILSLNRQLAEQATLASIKGGPHAHGNLEALLNIVVGLALGLLAVNAWLKQAISWLFILGTLMLFVF